jgi:hypothetical protein
MLQNQLSPPLSKHILDKNAALLGILLRQCCSIWSQGGQAVECKQADDTTVPSGVAHDTHTPYKGKH